MVFMYHCLTELLLLDIGVLAAFQTPKDWRHIIQKEQMRETLSDSSSLHMRLSDFHCLAAGLTSRLLSSISNGQHRQTHAVLQCKPAPADTLAALQLCAVAFVNMLPNMVIPHLRTQD